MPVSRRPRGTRNTFAISSSFWSAAAMPARTFRYTGGNTIRAEINSGRERLSSHTRARMMKDTTGTAFTAAVRG